LGEINDTVSSILLVYSVNNLPGLDRPGPPGAHPSRETAGDREQVTGNSQRIPRARRKARSAEVFPLSRSSGEGTACGSAGAVSADPRAGVRGAARRTTPSPPDAKKQRPPRSVEIGTGVADEKAGGAVLSHRVAPAVPSAQQGLTSEFGMGSGGSPAP
jgi:hypothetical protein